MLVLPARCAAPANVSGVQNSTCLAVLSCSIGAIDSETL